MKAADVILKFIFMINKHHLTSITWNGFFWGALGGISLLVIIQLTKNPPLMISPYPLFLIASILAMALSDKSKITLSKLFLTGLISFMAMTMILYLYIVLIDNPHAGISAIGHLWRIGMMLGIGMFSSLLVSIIVREVAR
jgi:hypothetical protein